MQLPYSGEKIAQEIKLIYIRFFSVLVFFWSSLIDKIISFFWFIFFIIFIVIG